MKKSKCKVLLVLVLILCTFSRETVFAEQSNQTKGYATKEYVFDLLLPLLQDFTQEPMKVQGNTSIEKAKTLNLTSDLNKNAYVSHEQMACILVKAVNTLEIEGEKALVYAYKNQKINDQDLIEPWARGYVTLAINNELMSLNNGGDFAPMALVTKEQVNEMVSRLNVNLDSKKFLEVRERFKNEMAYTLNQALYLGADSSKRISFNLMELLGKTEKEVEKRLGKASHKGFYKWMGYDALAYKERKLVVYFDKNQAVGFSIDNSEKNSTFNGTVGFLKRHYTLDNIETEFEGALHLDGIDPKNPVRGYYVYEIFSETGSRYIELIWNHEKEYMGLVYLAKKHSYKPSH